MRFRRCGLALVLCVCVVSGVRAQEAVSTASVSGRVVDQLGEVVPGATVVARHVETNVSRDAITDAGGRFRLPYLRIGRYEIVARLAGSRTPAGH